MSTAEKKSSPKVKPIKNSKKTPPVIMKRKSKSPPTRTRGGDVINLAPLISAVLLAAAKLSLEKKKTKSAAPASASKSRTQSR